ncbi:MAG: SCP2 sterol-binding domain-containing protein [Candidatus Hermodarchaeota archaeon]
MVTREEVIEAVEQARGKILDEKNAKYFKNWTRTILYFFPDTNDYLNIKVIDGKPQDLIEGEIEDYDIKFEMTTDILVGIMRGEINGLKAFATGMVKVKASMRDIMKLQKLV